MSTDSPAKTLLIISFIAFQFLSITSMIADSSFAFSSDQQTSIFFFPFSSIHIFATVSPQWVFLSPLRVTWMCLLFSLASAGNTDKIKQRKYISLPISSFLLYLYYQVSMTRVSACKNTDLFRNCQKFYENSYELFQQCYDKCFLFRTSHNNIQPSLHLCSEGWVIMLMS